MNTVAHHACIFLAVLVGHGAGQGNDDRFIEFENALPGKVIKIKKEWDPSAQRMRTVSNVPEVAGASDLLALEEVEASARRIAHGNLYPGLAEKAAAMDETDGLRVCIRIKSRRHIHLDKTRYAEKVLRQDALDWLGQGPVVHPSEPAGRHGLQVLEYRGTDIAVVLADKRALEALKVDADIAAVWEDPVEVRLAPELPTLATSAYMGSIPSGTGSGVRAATFEDGLTSTFLSCIGVTPASYDAFTLTDNQAKRHSQAAFRLLTSSAPSATFYHRNSSTYNSTGDVNYIVNNGIQTLSMSVTKGNTVPYTATYSEFLTMDGMAYTYPFPVFVNPAGNAGYDYRVNWQGYNAISVGNVRHTNENTYEMAECTQTKNPAPIYTGSCISGSGSTCAGDREMPHIVVPGSASTGTTFNTTCLEGSGTVGCGTSWSAPVGNGMAAAVIGADSRLVAWPEKVRATLILTAQNVESGDWTVSGDERDGTGTVSGADAVSFAQGHTSVSPNNSACEKGMSATSFYASDFGSNKRFYFLVPNPKPSGKHLRVVLTWDSNPNVSNGTNNLSDLDLIVQRNGGYQSSSSWDSNVEVVDIAAADLTAGSSYYIDISPYANRIPSGSSFFYYAIAWSWVKDHAP